MPIRTSLPLSLSLTLPFPLSLYLSYLLHLFRCGNRNRLGPKSRNLRADSQLRRRLLLSFEVADRGRCRTESSAVPPFGVCAPLFCVCVCVIYEVILPAGDLASAAITQLDLCLDSRLNALCIFVTIEFTSFSLSLSFPNLFLSASPSLSFSFSVLCHFHSL